MGVGSFRARFEDVSARLTAAEGALRLEGSARVESISIRNPPEFREHVVNGEDWFDSGRYPEIRFASDHVRVGDDGTLELTGELTIKDVTQPITATGTHRPPTDDPYGNVRIAVDLSSTIDRRDFDLRSQAVLPKGGNVLEWDVAIDVPSN